MASRVENDFYPTSSKDVLSCLSLLDIVDLQYKYRVLDIGCGYGVWGKVLRTNFANYNFEITGVDIQEFNKNEYYDNWYNNFNFLEYGISENLGKFDIVISNPPFKYAQEIIELSHDLLYSNGQMIALLRLAFLESQSRFDFWKRFKPEKVAVFSKRPSFTGNSKTYPMAFAAYKWNEKPNNKTELLWLDWKHND